MILCEKKDDFKLLPWWLVFICAVSAICVWTYINA